MDLSDPACLDNLVSFGLNGRVDMRPTLLRVLTDLYVQKPTHTADEDRHYTELALRLFEVVDTPTRAIVAARLASHGAPPVRVMQRLAGDLPDVAAALQSHAQVPIAAAAPAVAQAPAQREAEPDADASTVVARTIPADVAHELNELFFGGNPDERRLILRNLDVAAARTPARFAITPDPSAGKRLEAAALARSREGFAQQLALSLGISQQQARRIARDDLGEAIVVAAKALQVPRELLYRILLFINTAIGHSVERVHALAELYDEITVRAAEEFIAIWRALEPAERVSAAHQPLLWNDDTQRRAPARQRSALAAPPQKIERRDAS